MTSIKFYDYPEDAPCQCGNCEWMGQAEDTHIISDAHDRITVGEECPAGECPECGSLAYLVKKGNTDRFKDYVVEWQIDQSASSPLEAARQARACQANGTTAVVFDVIDEEGVTVRVDLLEHDAPERRALLSASKWLIVFDGDYANESEVFDTEREADEFMLGKFQPLWDESKRGPYPTELSVVVDAIEEPSFGWTKEELTFSIEVSEGVLKQHKTRQTIEQLVAASKELLHQVDQMEGMFDDEDGSIEAAKEASAQAVVEAEALLSEN